MIAEKRVILSADEAMARLDWGDDGEVRVRSNPAVDVFTEARWNRRSVRAQFKRKGVEETGPAATRDGFGVCSHDGVGWLFFATRAKPAVNGRGQYKRGRAFEHRTRDKLTAAGYWVVRAAGSRTVVDMVAVRLAAPGHAPTVLFVQCKRTGSISSAEWNALFEAAERVGAVPVLAAMPGKTGVAFHEIYARREPRSKAKPMRPFAVAPAGEGEAT